MLKKIFAVIISIAIAIILLTNFQGQPLIAESTDDPTQKLREIQNQIVETEKKLAEARGQEKTLKSQLDFIDTQTKLTELKMAQAEAQIIKLEKEITDLSNRIIKLSQTVDSITEVLLSRIVQTYKYGNYSTIDLLFSSHGFSDLLARVKYIQVAQANDKKVLYQLQATKETYNDQKTDRETRQAQQEKLKKDLERYQVQLDNQKKAKQELLEKTKNDESRYQQLITQLKAEQESIAKAISNIGVTIGPVSKGQQIAAMGSTGCSTGPHLHFEVYENAKVEGGRIVGNRINPHNFLDNGKLGSPLSGFPGGGWLITTEYNEPYYVFGYKSYHTGLDIAPTGGSGLGRPIQTSENGIAYSTSATCECYVKKTCTKEMIDGGSAVGKGVVVDHQNGLVTLYWHTL